MHTSFNREEVFLSFFNPSVDKLHLKVFFRLKINTNFYYGPYILLFFWRDLKIEISEVQAEVTNMCVNALTHPTKQSAVPKVPYSLERSQLTLSRTLEAAVCRCFWK